MGHLLIIGAGKHAKIILDYAHHHYRSITFMSNDNHSPGIEGYPFIYERETSIAYIEQHFDEIIIAIDDNTARLQRSQEYAAHHIKLAAVIHDTAAVSEKAQIGGGTVILANAIIYPYVTIGQCCIIDNSAIIERGCVLHNGVHIASNVEVNREVIIGEKTKVCVGSSIAKDVKIGANSVVQASSVVIQDVPDNVVVGGVPARIQKRIS